MYAYTSFLILWTFTYSVLNGRAMRHTCVCYNIHHTLTENDFWEEVHVIKLLCSVNGKVVNPSPLGCHYRAGKQQTEVKSQHCLHNLSIQQMPFNCVCLHVFLDTMLQYKSKYCFDRSIGCFSISAAASAI